MATLSFMQMSEGDLTETLNKGKEIFVKGLVRDGFLTEEQADNISKNYAIVATRQGWLGSVIDTIINANDPVDNNSIIIRIVKLL